MRGHNTTIQNAMVFEHLRSAPITPKEALQRYGCFRLAARIYDLRQVGHQIITNRVMNDEGNPYAEYHLLRQVERLLNQQLHLFTRRKPARPPAALEVKVHIALADTIKLALTPGWMWFHYPSGGNRDAITGALLKRMGTLAGVSDFLLFGPPHATLHALELKRRGRKPSPAQMSFLALVRLVGGKSDWADSYEDAIAILSARGAVRVRL